MTFSRKRPDSDERAAAWASNRVRDVSRVAGVDVRHLGACRRGRARGKSARCSAVDGRLRLRAASGTRIGGNGAGGFGVSAQRASASSVGLLVAKRRADGLARAAAGGVVSVLRRVGPGTASRRRLGAAGLDLRELDRLGGLGVLPLGCGRVLVRWSAGWRATPGVARIRRIGARRLRRLRVGRMRPSRARRS